MASVEQTVSLMHRRGFVYPSSEIYGGLQASFDYAHYGVMLKSNVKRRWTEAMRGHREIVLQDAAILMHPRVWEASGHVDRFSDPLVQCLGACKRRWRADHLDGDRCPDCDGELADPVDFNVMFSTELGASGDSSARVWLRPETAQAMFVNFKTTMDTQRSAEIPFGIAQIGKAFRNEITPRNFLFRTREFEQAELEYFVHPDRASDEYDEWRARRLEWWHGLGIDPERLRLRDHADDELAHYAIAAADVEYRFDDLGWSEVEGIANRGDFDLLAHAAATGAKLRASTPDGTVVPYVIEPSLGIDRAVLALVADAHRIERVGDGERVVLGLHPRLAPVTVAVMPVVKHGEVREAADSLEMSLRGRFSSEFDPVGKIGKAYRRQDEIGTPWCVTVDHVTFEDGTVTIRDRDSMEQVRIPMEGVAAWLDDALVAAG